MKRFRGVQHLIYLVLLFGVLGGLLGGQVVFATQESGNDSFLPPPNQAQPPPPEPPEEEFEITSQFPVVRGESGTELEFDVSLSYKGSEPKVFDFAVTLPPEWQASIKPRFSTKEEQSVLAIRMEPSWESPAIVKVFIGPLPEILPEPGDYVFTFEASSGDLTDSIELKGVVTEVPLSYKLDMITTTGRLDILAKAGEDKTISIKLTNSGTGVIEGIHFTRVVSEGWNTTFTPSDIESLEPGMSQEVDVVITPPRKTIAADYNVTLSSIGGQAADSISLRVKVQTPTIWGRAGIGIIAGIIASLVVVFRRFGRR